MKKILVIYASAGDGHKVASEAVYNALVNLKTPDTKADIIDSLNYTRRFFKFSYKTGYIFMVKYIPTIWGFFYHMFDSRFIYSFIRPLRAVNNSLNARSLEDFLIRESFDVVVSTHFLAAEVICRMKSRGFKTTLINVITDFKPHLFWQARGVDLYVVAAELTKNMLIERGVDPGIIKVFGIPVDSKFAVFIPKQQARRSLRLYPEKQTVLVMGGGFGVGPIEDIVRQLQAIQGDFQIVVVCGHNERLKHRLWAARGSFRKPTTIFGFCRNIDEIMSASDIMVTKVGGITAAEALVKVLPIVSIRPIPGQEMRNADFLFENNAGIKADSVADAVCKISDMLKDHNRMNEIRSAMECVAMPYASADIARLAIEWAQKT